MERHVSTGAALLVAVAVFAAGLPALRAQSLLPLEDYRVIVERKPFGDLAGYKKRGADDAAAAAAAEEAQAAKDQQTLAKQIDLVAVNITLRGSISVGFVDKSVKPARSFYLGIGESEGGYTVESADYAEETATISKGNVKVTLKMGTGLVAEGASSSGAPGGDGGQAKDNAVAKADAGGDGQERIRPRVIRRPGLGGAGGYRSNLLERKRAEDAAHAEEESRRRESDIKRLRQASDDAAAQREHDMNYKLLLEGKEPVSEIHLTPEEEAELESKGLLPPSGGE